MSEDSGAAWAPGRGPRSVTPRHKLFAERDFTRAEALIARVVFVCSGLGSNHPDGSRGEVHIVPADPRAGTNIASVGSKLQMGPGAG